MLIGLVTDVITTVLLVAVRLLAAELFELSVAVAVKVSVPSSSPLTSSPLIVQVPSPAIVVVWAVVECVPSLATSETVAPAWPVPLTVTD